MATLSRINWVGQQRADLHDFLGADSFTAFDFRVLVSAFAGYDKAYVLRGFEVIGSTDLSINIKLSDSLVFNPLDANGSFYYGLVSDADQMVTLPSNQTNIFVEAKFKNVSSNPISRGIWDPLALSGEDDSGNEFSSSINFENSIELEISTNTTGFSEDAIPLLRASTTTTITSMVDCRPMMFRLGTGGANPNPVNKYGFSSSRAESVPSGIGVGDAADSPWKSRDNSGAINDKAIKSFKELFDAMMTRISEISGSAFWYYNGLLSAPVSGISLNQMFFDTMGHSLEPSLRAAFKWERVGGNLTLIGEGGDQTGAPFNNGLIKWKSNYTGLSWQLGKTFNSASDRRYSALNFEADAPIDGGNIYLLLEREVSKGSGAAVKWGSATSWGTSPDSTRTVEGNAGDFTGVAIGDYIRKDSEGYSQYYKVTQLWDGSTAYTTAGAVASGLIIAVLVEHISDPTLAITPTTEPLKYFRANYSEDDLVSDTVSQTYSNQHVNYYWLGRRLGSLFFLKDYGTLQEGEEVLTMDGQLAQGRSGGLNDVILEHAYGSVYDGSGYRLKTGATTTLLTLRRYKRDDTVETPTPGSDNSNAILEYTINAPVGLMSVGDGLWVRLSDTTGGVLASGAVTNSTDDLQNTDTVTNRWEVRSIANTPARTFDDKDVYLVARRVSIGGYNALIFADGSVLNEFGQFFNNHVEVKGDLRLYNRPVTAVPFIHDTNVGVVDTDVSNFFFDKPSGVLGVFNFRASLNDFDVAVSADVNLFASLGQKTLYIGSADSTVYVRGNFHVEGDSVAIQVAQIQSEDKLITLGVGNLLDGGYKSGVEVADNTISATNIQAFIGSSDVVITLASAPGYLLGDTIGVSSSDSVGGVPSGDISGSYLIVTTLSSPGDATISGSTLTLRVPVVATSNQSIVPVSVKSFRPEWDFVVSGADGLSGYTSWRFKAKYVSTTPTLTPVFGYQTVPTADATTFSSGRIPFAGNDNSGSGGSDTTLNFSSNLTWDGSLLTVGGDIVPAVDGTFKLGSLSAPVAMWKSLNVSSGVGASGYGVFFGDVNTYFYSLSSGIIGTDTNLYVGGYNDWANQSPDPDAPATGDVRVFAADDLVWQRDEFGEIKMLTNIEGNVYHEYVDVVAVPANDNEMVPIGAPPSTVTLPKDSKKFIGSGLKADVVSGFPDVTVYKKNHGLLIGETIYVDTSVAIGGISAVDLSGTFVVTNTTANTFEYTAAANAVTTTSGYIDSIEADSIRWYVVGNRELEVYLNGILLRRDDDWEEVGPMGGLSNAVTFNIPIVLGDVVEYRIDSNGGMYVINAGGGGSGSLQNAYNAGNIINVSVGIPVLLSGTGTLMHIQADLQVDGIII